MTKDVSPTRHKFHNNGPLFFSLLKKQTPNGTISFICYVEVAPGKYDWLFFKDTDSFEVVAAQLRNTEPAVLALAAVERRLGAPELAADLLDPRPGSRLAQRERELLLGLLRRLHRLVPPADQGIPAARML